MRLIDTTRKLPLARVLALVALLCAGALQVQEAGHGHWHGLDDSYSQCLVYKNSGPADPAVEVAQPPIPVGNCLIAERGSFALSTAQASPFLARGPPAHS